MSRHLVTTDPTPTPCNRCGRLELIGLEEGLPYRVEPAPLTLEAELQALLAGRRSYALIAGQIAYRDDTRIRGDKRRGGRPPVFPEHDCASPVTAADIDTTHLRTVAAFLAKITKKPETVNPNLPTATETDALFLLSRQLGGRVIAVVDDPAPF